MAYKKDVRDYRQSVNARGKKTRNPGWKAGDHWVQCDRCASAIRTSDSMVTWDNLIVCPDDWEIRHPQDFVRGRADNIAAKGLVRSESGDIFINETKAVTSAPTNVMTSVVGVAAQAEVTITWDIVTGATSYKLFRDGVPIETNITLLTTSDFPNTGTFSYTVSALNEFGESPQSDPSIATVLSFVPDTFNPALTSSQITLSNGNLTALTDGGANADRSASFGGHSSGKYYFEMTIDRDDHGTNWIGGITANTAQEFFVFATPKAVLENNPGIIIDTTTIPLIGLDRMDPGDIGGFAFDLDNLEAFFSINGVYVLDGDPETRANPIALTSATYHAVFYSNALNEVVGTTANFGASLFNTPAPTGYTPGWPAS